MTYQKDKGKEIQVKCLSVYNFLDTNDWGQHWTVTLTGATLAQDKLNLRVSQSDERFKSSGSHAEWRIKNKTHF